MLELEDKIVGMAVWKQTKSLKSIKKWPAKLKAITWWTTNIKNEYNRIALERNKG